MAFGGFLGQTVSKAGDAISDLGSQIDDTVNDSVPGGWATVALIAAGYYYAPEIGAYISAEGAAIPASEVAALDATGGATASAVTGNAAGAAAGVPITTAATGAATVPGVLGTSLTATQMAQLAKLGVSAASLIGGAKAVSNSGGSGGGLLTQQDRSGFSSGSANYSPEYYAAIQNKYNQYMPGAKGADITTDLKNWYETKYTPNAAVAGNSTLNTTGTGYTTPTSMTNLGIKPQTVAPTYSTLNPTTSTAANVGTEYAKYIAANGGNTPENRAAAIQYLQTKGFSGPQIDAAYNQYLGTLPASTGTTAETMAANATPAQIAQAYGAYAAANGGDNQANQAAAIQYLQKIGVPYATIEAAYPIYKSSLTQAPAQTGGGGMLTGAAQAAQTTQTPTTPLASAAIASNASQPSYTSLSGSSSPAAIAAAYKDFVGGSGGDTQANQAAAIQYLSNLGVDQNTINQAYGLFKG